MVDDDVDEMMSALDESQDGGYTVSRGHYKSRPRNMSDIILVILLSLKMTHLRPVLSSHLVPSRVTLPYHRIPHGMAAAALHQTGQQTKQDKTRLDQDRQQLVQKQAAKRATVTHPHTKSSTHIRVSGKEKRPAATTTGICVFTFNTHASKRYPKPSALDQIDQIPAAVDKSWAPGQVLRSRACLGRSTPQEL